MILKGQKVILRPVKMSDAPRFVKWFNDPAVHRFLQLRKMNLKDERQWIKDRLAGKVKNDLHLCIDTISGIHIGSIGLHNISPTDKRASFGIMIGNRKFWNQGLGSEAAKLIIDYGFNKLKLHRIDLDVYANNPRAIKVYKRLGFKMEGIKRQHRFWAGKFYDSYFMSVLAKEWKAKI